MNIYPEITAEQIAEWAKRPDAQFDLPELLRRLIYASGATVHSMSAPVGKGTNAGGYDIRLDVHGARDHVPAGEYWRKSYKRIVEDQPELPWKTLEECHAAVCAFLDPVLAGVEGTWKPALWKWA